MIARHLFQQGRAVFLMDAGIFTSPLSAADSPVAGKVLTSKRNPYFEGHAEWTIPLAMGGWLLAVMPIPEQGKRLELIKTFTGLMTAN